MIWQTGPRYFEQVRGGVDDHPRLRVLQFIERMDMAYAACNLAICRSGALTCSELLATGTPAILIPSPNVAEDHQTKNARGMEAINAAIVLPEAQMRSRLYDLWRELFNDIERLQAMAADAKENAKPDAAEAIAADVLKLAEMRWV